MELKKIFKLSNVPLLIVILLVSAFLGTTWYRYDLTVKQLTSTRNDVAQKTAKIAELKNTINTLGGAVREFEESLSHSKNENVNLSTTLTNEQSKNTLFETQIKAISGTVGVLKKLSETDKELLQKYSKVYFLNENYIPSHLTFIDQKYIYKKDKPLQIHTNVYPFLSMLLDAAMATNTPFQIISAYRSFAEQASLKTNYKITYGAGANKFSADQGYSEHQLGTTLDFTTSALGITFTSFAKTSAYSWLRDNAYKYGFVLSYPKDNAYYQFEPWHWRFVGIQLATKLHAENLHFYDLSQREIDSYLVSIF